LQANPHSLQSKQLSVGRCPLFLFYIESFFKIIRLNCEQFVNISKKLKLFALQIRLYICSAFYFSEFCDYTSKKDFWERKQNIFNERKLKHDILTFCKKFQKRSKQAWAA